MRVFARAVIAVALAGVLGCNKGSTPATSELGGVANVTNVQPSDEAGVRGPVADPQDSTGSWIVRPRSDDGASHRPLYRRRWGVVIGIDGFRDAGWPPLGACEADARAVAVRLGQLHFDGVISLLGPRATRANIVTTLRRELPEKLGTEDLVVIFVATHGRAVRSSDGGESGYLATWDALPDAVEGTALAMSELNDLSRHLIAKHVYIAIDACYAGLEVTRAAGRPRSTNESASSFVNAVTERRALQVVAAGGAGEQAHERDGHGVFTSALCEALGGEADADHDGVTTATEIGAFVRKRVGDATAGQQLPRFGTIAGEGEVVFGSATLAGTSAPAEAERVDPARCVYDDAGSVINHGVWSNWMAAPSVVGGAARMMTLDLASLEHPHGGANCARVDVRLNVSQAWCGIALATRPHAWAPAHGPVADPTAMVVQPGDSLVYWARGARGGEGLSIKAGSLRVRPGDADVIGVSTSITLTRSWQRFAHIVTGGEPLRFMHPFVFVVDRAGNPGATSVTFYLDDIQYVHGH